MKRFVIVTGARGQVLDVVQCETTAEALAECQKYDKVSEASAIWVKTSSMESLAELDI